ncbi:hypothetical protein [Acidithrix ferrooxidans]|uniref:hypothetical protein n=1 Tax=Acidithrix ferrooxidans TaxID=1280514 RepID=UPI001BB87E05|nr:hypothetical protein [Acidithrix ferrooxidans]CAG4930113.1 unnamed protein product [Acidithrix sp. C25]
MTISAGLFNFEASAFVAGNPVKGKVPIVAEVVDVVDVGTAFVVDEEATELPEDPHAANNIPVVKAIPTNIEPLFGKVFSNSSTS